MSDQSLPKPTSAPAIGAAGTPTLSSPPQGGTQASGPKSGPNAGVNAGSNQNQTPKPLAPAPALPEIEDIPPASGSDKRFGSAPAASQPPKPPQPPAQPVPSMPPKPVASPGAPAAQPPASAALPNPVPPKEMGAGPNTGKLPKPQAPANPVPKPAAAASTTLPMGQPVSVGGGNPAPAAAPAAPQPPLPPKPPQPAQPPAQPVPPMPPKPVAPPGAPPLPAVPPAPNKPPTPRPPISAVPPMPKPGGGPAAGVAPLPATPAGTPAAKMGGLPGTAPAATPSVGQPLPPLPGATPGVGAPLPPSPLKPGTPPAPLTAPTTPGATSAPLPLPGAPAPVAGTVAAAKPPAATPKKSMLRFLPFIIGGLAVLGVIAFLLMRVFGGPSDFGSDEPGTDGTSGDTPSRTTSGDPVSLTYWGLWEPDEVMEQVLAEYMEANPNVEVNYTKQSPQDYRERLQTAIASGNGPDIFRFHASWVPMLKDELAALPNSVMSTAEYQRTFYPVAAQQLTDNGQVVGIPLMYDGLVLYYNKDMLQTAGAEVPTTWSALRTLAMQLTVRSASGLERGGLAVGNASNVEHYGDIIGLLMLQNGADLSNPTTNEARDALTFYTNFVKADKVWDETLPSSTVAFARGEAAMMIAPSWRALEIQAANPSLNFGTASVPTLAENKMTWATYWAEGVSEQSDEQTAAWQLLKYLSSAETMKKLYAAQADVRNFGEPYSRVDLASELASDPYVGAVLNDAPSAKGSYLNTFTFDNGLNDQLLKYYADAINAILAGKQPAETLPTLDQGTKQVLRQYGVSTSSQGGS